MNKKRKIMTGVILAIFIVGVFGRYLFWGDTANQVMAIEDTKVIEEYEDEYEDEDLLDDQSVSAFTIIEDTEAPVITCEDDGILSLLGTSIAYMQSITVTDNIDSNPTLDIDNSDVDIDTVGTYTVVCTATDASGNVTVAEFPVEITKDLEMNDKVEAAAEAVLYSIVNDSMTDYEKAKAIYYWCRYNIGWRSGASTDSWTQGAYDGLITGSGSCFTYASTAKYLLTMAGVPNMDISTSQHYWNLVDVGDGWQHFDATLRSDGTIIFLMSDEDLMAYTAAKDSGHDYDRSLYPEIQ